ncbi:MAG: alpha/beta fold hydrolase [Gaiellaceae bacterium]
MSEIRANGVSLYYEERGAGEPILCIHGTGSSAAFWAEAAEELATRGRSIVYDRRGCFRSERPEPYATSVSQQTDDAAALLDAFGAAPAIVNGRSYGGAIALDLALRYPDRVRALVLLEPADIGLPLSEPAARWLADIEEQVLAAAEADMSSVAETLMRGALGDEAWEGFPDPAKHMFTGNGPAIVAEFRGGVLDVGAEQLDTIVQPTLLVAAEGSPPAFAELTKLIAAAMPSARLERVEGGHAIDPAHPVVLAFVDEVLALKEEPSIA